MPKSTKTSKKRTKAKRRMMLAGLISVAFVAVILIVGGAFALSLLGKVDFVDDSTTSYFESIDRDPIDSDDSDVVVEQPDIDDQAPSLEDVEALGNTKNITNILLLGVETGGYNTYVGRSDAIIVMSINKQTKTIKLISLLRDLYVDIPDRGYDKLTHAYAYGRFDLLSKTIEKNLRLKIDQYVAVNFSAFSTAVDAFGGIDINLTAKEAVYMKRGTDAGSYFMNGNQALDYARIRNIGTDFGRTSRQRTVIQALMTKAKSSNVATLYKVMDAALPKVSTNMTKNAFANYIVNSASYLKYDMKEYSLPKGGDYEGKRLKGVGDVLILNDMKASVLALQHEIYG